MQLAMSTLYSSALSGPEDLADWILEGPMVASFPTGRLRLESAAEPAEGQAANFVAWLPVEHQGDVRISWSFRPLREPGLAMIFWAAQARGGGSLHDPALPARTGEYEQYHSGAIDALKNVEMPMMYAGINPRDRRERAAHLLEQMGMADRMNHSPAALSGGQKQRVAIARALANDPPLLLADEPTGALDSQTGRMVMDRFHELNREQGKTIVFITHNPELAAETDRIVTMVDGRITEEVSQ